MAPEGGTTVSVVEVADLSDPRLTDYSHQTDVALKKARGTEHGLYIAESALVLQRALSAGHRPRFPAKSSHEPLL